MVKTEPGYNAGSASFSDRRPHHSKSEHTDVKVFETSLLWNIPNTTAPYKHNAFDINDASTHPDITNFKVRFGVQ